SARRENFGGFFSIMKLKTKIANGSTEQKAHEFEVARLTRLYAALSEINKSIVRTHRRDELFGQICRTLVKPGGFHMAWIGLIDSETHQVNPVAQSGDDTDYLSHVTVYADKRPKGKGPTGTAIREGRNYICNDFVHDPHTVPWHEPAARAGFRASAAFPIRQNDIVCGALTVYSGEIGFFQDKEIALLEEAASDVSFALDNIAREETRQHAEEKVLENEQLFRNLA